MKYMIFILTITCILFSCVKNKAEDSIRLIPKGYKGPVLIVFNQQDGTPVEYEGDKRLYRIPKTGILRTQFKPNYGFQQHEFFYVDSLNRRVEIPFIIVQEKDSISKIKDRTKTFAFGESAPGEGKGYDPSKGKFTIPHTREFYIGNISNIEESLREILWFSNKNLEKLRIYEK